MSVFAKRLKNLRDNEKQSQKHLAMVLGKSRESVSKYESGEREPDLSSIVTLARHFHVSADYMIGLTNEKQFSLNTVSSVDSSKPARICNLERYAQCFEDQSFLPYIELALKIKANDLDLETVEQLVDEMIKSKKA